MSPIITALKVQKRNTKRVNVFLDGEFAFALAHVLAAWLRVGEALSPEKIAELKSLDEQEMAFQQASRLLALRPRSEVEVRRNLTKHGYSEAAITATLERLRRDGLVNDERFAQAWVENRSEFRPRSRRLLALEMRQHGLDEADAAQALQGVDDETLAYRAAQAYARKLKTTEWLEFRRKVAGFLARRGFGYEVALSTTRQVWNELHSASHD